MSAQEGLTNGAGAYTYGQSKCITLALQTAFKANKMWGTHWPWKKTLNIHIHDTWIFQKLSTKKKKKSKPSVCYWESGWWKHAARLVMQGSNHNLVILSLCVRHAAVEGGLIVPHCTKASKNVTLNVKHFFRVYSYKIFNNRKKKNMFGIKTPFVIIY